MATASTFEDSLLYVRDGHDTARWNFSAAVGTPVAQPGGMGEAASVTYSFLSAVPSYFSTSGFRAFTSTEQQAARDALQSWSAVARVNFQEVSGVGTMTFGMNAQSGSAGYAYTPAFGYRYDGSGLITSVTPVQTAGDVWLNSRIAWSASDFARGGDGLGTLIHEIGHALGLKHPFESDGGGAVLDPSLDHSGWTVMSYTEHPHAMWRDVVDHGNGSWSWTYTPLEPETPMIGDIAALQALYGANTAWHAGNDTYTFDPARPFLKTIWDGGGSDTISVANFTQGCSINLNAGSFSSIRIPSDPLPPGSVETRTDVYDGTDNLGIAYGVTIENAVGGSGADRLTGNGASNRLTGNAGNDALSGNGGHDTLDGGTGADSMAGGAGNDTYLVDHTGDRVTETDANAATGGTDAVWSSLPSLTLPANVENGRITTGGTASMTGNALANVITAGAGHNTLDGGAGIDTVDYSQAGAAVKVSLASTAAQATGGSGSDKLLNFERLTGSAHADTLTGSAGDNVITGGAGADRLQGLGGADRFVLNSLSGSDTITDFASGNDQLLLRQSAIRVGDGDTVVEGAVTRAGTGGFATSAELVVISGNIAGSITAASAAARIGNATSSYGVDAHVLFVVDNGSSSALFLFDAANADAAVSASELTLLATLSATPAPTVGDILFG